MKTLFEKIFSPEQMLSSAEHLEPYGKDESDTGFFAPELVIFPANAQQVSDAFKICRSRRIALTPCGARSGKSGGSLPLKGGVVMSFERMNAIKAVSVEDMTAVVQPGVILKHLMDAVEQKGLFYPPDPNSLEYCTLGGNIAENAGGPRALKYGVTKEYVLGMEWVTPSGDILQVGKKTVKGVAGYDLVGLFVGSEGTLGVATEITLQLIPLPKYVKTALLVFPKVMDAARTVSATLANGLLPRTLELFDELSVKAVDGKGISFPPGTGAALLVEFDGTHEEGLMEELASMDGFASAHGCTESWFAHDESQRQKLWATRRTLSTALRALRRYKVSEDIVVPRSQVPEIIERLKGLGEKMNFPVATYGHAGDGNLHANILFDSPDDRPRVNQMVDQMFRWTVELGGTLTGEHGVGYAKRDYLSLEQSQPLIDLQHQLKKLLDPEGFLNPGKIFPDS